MTAGDIEPITAALAKIDIGVTEIRIRLEGALDTSKDHECRIRRLERMAWLASGAAGSVGGAIGALATSLAGGIPQ
jgi:hypothetical protein